MTRKPYRRSLALAGAFALGFILPSWLHAELRLPAVVGDHMVLQQEHPNPIWGWADPGQSVTARCAGKEFSATAGDSGRWTLNLPALPATYKPMEISIFCGEETRTLKNVRVGEVWLCSGQSNMQWRLLQSTGGEEAAAGGNRPNIHLFQIPLVSKRTLQDDVKATWAPCADDKAGNFSAVAYYFGVELERELQVPIGLIQSAWGGSRIEPWVPMAGYEGIAELDGLVSDIRVASPGTPEYIEARRAYVTEIDKWIGQASSALDKSGTLPDLPEAPPELQENNQSPHVLYNAMIHPVVPYGLRGAIWYQGESNVNEGMLYTHKTRALVQGWRKVFHNEDLAFYFVQLAPFNYGNPPHVLPEFWEAQTACLGIPGTGMAVINDISTINNIHPPNKRDVGKRLALQALAKNYGKHDLVCSGPLYQKHTTNGPSVSIFFEHAPNGLKTRDGKAVSHFEIAGSSGAFVPALAVIDGSTVVVSSPEVPEPMQVRFAWSKTAEPNLANKEGLPASAFRTPAR